MIHKNYPMVELKTAPFYPLWLLVMEWQDRLASSLVKLYLQTVDLLWDVRQYFPDGPEIVSIYLVKFNNHDGSRWISMDHDGYLVKFNNHDGKNCLREIEIQF